MNIFRKGTMILFVMLILCSCGKGQPKEIKPVELDETLTLDGKITQDDFSCSAVLKRGGDGTWETEFSSPTSISGMKVKCSGDVCTLELDDLNYSFERDKLSKAGMISLLTKSTDKLISQNDLLCVSDGETIRENGNVDGENFTAEFDDKKLKKITVGNYLTAEFS